MFMYRLFRKFLKRARSMKGGKLKITLVYLALSIVWITLSDSLILLTEGHVSHAVFGLFNTGKGIFFVLLTGLLIYLLIGRSEHKILQREQQLQDLNVELLLRKKKLAEVLERYELASQATGDMIYDLDLTHGTVIFSKQILYLTGIPVTETGGDVTWWRSLVHPDDLEDLILSQYASVENTEVFWHGEYRIRAGNGMYKYVSDQSYLLFDDEQKPIRVIGAVKDIDLLKHNTEQLKSMGEILNKINIPVLISSPQGIINWVNPAFLIKTGFTEKEMIGKSMVELLFCYNSDNQLIRRLETAISRQESFNAEFINYCNSKQGYWISFNLSPVFDASGQFESYISVQDDITERKEREAEIARQNEKLKAFSWLNSHQIRRPVASILSLVQLLKDSQLQDDQKELLDMLHQSSVELDNIIHQINAEVSGKQ